MNEFSEGAVTDSQEIVFLTRASSRGRRKRFKVPGSKFKVFKSGLRVQGVEMKTRNRLLSYLEP
jgi:hypothetical protein